MITPDPAIASAVCRAMAANRVAHAYVVSGGNATTRRQASQWVAMQLNCERVAPGSQPAGPCGECNACHKITNQLHPDVVTLATSGAAGNIAIETVREMIASLALLPNEANTRVIIVEEATGLLGPAANALLKTLEEPPARTLFLLATASPELLLPTIRSRCQRLRLGGQHGTHDVPDPRIFELASAIATASSTLTAPITELASTISAKGDAAKSAHVAITEAAATLFGEQAIAAARTGDLPLAAQLANCAMICLQWQFSMRVHNASPGLATEALLLALQQQRSLA